MNTPKFMKSTVKNCICIAFVSMLAGGGITQISRASCNGTAGGCSTPNCVWIPPFQIGNIIVSGSWSKCTAKEGKQKFSAGGTSAFSSTASCANQMGGDRFCSMNVGECPDLQEAQTAGCGGGES